jgi:spermidine synthase
VSPILAAAIVFGSAFAVLVIEILAGRLLAPYVGVTLETYTGIIGTVLLGISLGTWLGGRLADRLEPHRLIGPLLAVGGLLALLIVPLVSFAGTLRLRPDPAGIVTYAALAFFAPAAVLSAINPVVVKLQLRDLGHTGSVVGWLSATGTAGAIAGTFVTGFVLVAAFPTRPILIALGAGLVVAGLAIAVTVGRARGLGPPVAGVAALVLATGWVIASPEPCERETAYFCIRVQPDPGLASGRTLLLDNLRHSYVDLDDPTYLEFSYTQLISDVVVTIAPAGEPIQALHVGGGGFTLPRYIAATRPRSQSRVLELDPNVLATAREELGLVTGPELEVRVGDARLGIADEPADSRDLVIGDAFGGAAVPWHLTTAEFLTEVRRVLRPSGMYAVNVIDYPPLGFARAELATLRSVFPHVAVFGPESRVNGTTGGNVILLASESPIPVDALAAANRARSDTDSVVVDPARLEQFIGDSPVLTDDFAPVDQLLTLPN